MAALGDGAPQATPTLADFCLQASSRTPPGMPCSTGFQEGSQGGTTWAAQAQPQREGR